jgi:hypothetical protein
MSTKALSAFLTARQTPLVATLARIGVDMKLAQAETISDDIVGRIARLFGFTPERLVELTAPYATPAS